MGTDRYEEGLKIRREVNGDEVVDRILNDTDEFSRPIQDLVTEYCWGEIWGRPGLDRRSRSILNIGMLAAMNRPDALAGHIRSGLVNGLTPEEVQECLLQVAVYAGMPAGLAAFKVAREVIAETA
ncbi:carboxymuconolactone decarboxylase family protein [Paenarthrobacter ureafaciens]|jgi:4-carboxymuconolactone decarboxylase|uniref:carboxymuconolactone decarboxylase family protein n=1 Tax=Paenarthrobacter ureafaciens TaxID=37931 RepID=UPI002DC02288|nr:carboxymuconolactone decarboxylase family protein [Paenarthrobacter ureafaciens]MEC3853106.1 carboxymuconolactone decarboxylase family protein [Paenarthrobacter ureafaciens]